MIIVPLKFLLYNIYNVYFTVPLLLTSFFSLLKEITLWKIQELRNSSQFPSDYLVVECIEEIESVYYWKKHIFHTFDRIFL